MNRAASCMLSIVITGVVLLVPFRFDLPMGRIQALPGLNGGGQRIAWPKQVETTRGALDLLAAPHVPDAAGPLTLDAGMNARSANALPPPRFGRDRLALITVDYPADGSIFPPDFAPPRLTWRDAAEDATVWLIDVSFSDGSTGIEVKSKGERLRIGEIDQRCIAESNKLPELTPEEAASRSWTPDSATWALIKKHSVERPATMSITGFRDDNATQAVSRGQCTIETSKDPVGAPIFYRDVPLVPGIGEKGVIKPLPDGVIPFIKWRLRNVGDTKSRTLMMGLHTCANCHSFSRDGKTLGMDVDGPQNDKGIYSITPVRRETSIRSENVVKWSSFRPVEDSDHIRVGFMSQISPDGRYVVTMINNPRPKGSGPLRTQDRIYVANFMDYRFGQVFFPTKGILAYYDRETRQLRPLPGADDPRYVQTGGFWSPDGKYIVFERAGAKDAAPEDAKPPRFANDPNETQMRYDLYRIPFNDGGGGAAEPIAGASRNGMSNNFPKVSPDGRWIVFVKCRNGQLMRPDSQLYIVPAQGGVARRMRCNTPLMNSWHSFSPNGHWLVFSSKGRSPYTQMFLTHIDEEGNDSPAILIEDATAANRAVNIPEFVNVQPDSFLKLDAPVTKFYEVFDRAMDLEKKQQYSAAVAEWDKALKLDPEDAKANYNLGLALTREGKLDEAVSHFRTAVEADPDLADAHNNLGIALVEKGHVDEAIPHFQDAVRLKTDFGDAQNNLGAALLENGKVDDAIPHFRKAVEVDPDFADAHNNLGIALVEKGHIDEAIQHFQEAVKLKPDYPNAQNNLGAALLQNGKVDDAITHFRKALQIDPRQVQTYSSLGGALYLQGKFTEALGRWRDGLRMDPNYLPLLNQTAWALATCPRASVRNGPEAVELAERAIKVSVGPGPELFDTLAAAYAEVGRFREALQTASRALDLATQEDAHQPLIEGLKARIALYKSNSPFRETQ